MYVVDDLRNYDQVVGLSCEDEWTLNRNAGVEEKYSYVKFTLP